VETAELFADGVVTYEELDHFHREAIIAWYRTLERKEGDPGYQTRLKRMAFAVDIAADNPFKTWRSRSSQAASLRVDASLKAVSPVLLRCVAGNPFRPVALDSAWLHWDGGTVRKIAQGIYDDRAFDRLPVLADALEETGCADRDLLDHCRSGGEHVRGCWAVDLLLGKE
jgi:hypothetical protein